MKVNSAMPVNMNATVQNKKQVKRSDVPVHAHEMKQAPQTNKNLGNKLNKIA